MSDQNRKTICIPVKESLAAVSRELIAISHALERVEVAVSEIAVDKTAASFSITESLKCIDEISQKLAAISIYTSELSGRVDIQWVVDPINAAKDITLSELVARLTFDKERSKLNALTPSVEPEIF